MTENEAPILLSFRSWLTILLFLCGSGLWSCKENEQNYFEEESLTQSIALGQMEAYDALEVDYLFEVELFLKNVSSLQDLDNCSHITNDPINKELIIDFGAGCSDIVFPFNRKRSGKIIVDYPNAIHDSTSARTIKFTDYYVSSRKIEGTIEVQYDSISKDTAKIYYTCRFINFAVTFPDATGVIYNGTQKRLWTTGENDGNPANNSYVITNDGDPLMGTTLDGHTFTSSVGVPVLLNYYCAVPGHYAGTNGSVIVPVLSGYDARTRQVALGAGDCDNAVTIITWRRSYSVSVD